MAEVKRIFGLPQLLVPRQRSLLYILRCAMSATPIFSTMPSDDIRAPSGNILTCQHVTMMRNASNDDLPASNDSFPKLLVTFGDCTVSRT